MLTPKRIFRAVVLFWLVFIAFWILFTAGTLVFVHGLGGDQGTVAGIATVGLRNISIPVMERAETAGLPEFLVFLLINGSATLVLFSLPSIVQLLDPASRNRFPRLIRRFSLNDPTLVVFTPLPAFRRISVPELKSLFATLVVAPLILPVLLAAIVGLLSGLIIDPGDVIRTVVFDAALILPHGIFEASALFLAPACMFSLYRGVRVDVEAGRTEAVWAALRPELRWKLWLPRLALALALIAVAGVIEAYATEPIADALAAWMGLDFGVYG